LPPGPERRSSKEHAKRVDMPADEVFEIADTVVIRPNPQRQVA
jgi:sporulation protein YlmC with PRC-barrel domain